MKSPKLKPIDLNKCCKKRGGDGESYHTDINSRKQYLVKHDGSYFAGYFSSEWFGWSFDTGFMFLDLDKPGTNGSQWQGIWEIT